MASYAQCVEAYIQYRSRVGYKILKHARAKARKIPKRKSFSKRFWTEKRDLEMRKLADSGMTAREIAQAMGIGLNTVTNHAQRAKIKTGRRKQV